MWLLKVVTNLEKVFSLKWRCAPRKSSSDEEGSVPQIQELDRLWNVHRSEPRTERHCLEDQMADTGFLETAEIGSHRLSGPSEEYNVRA